MQRKSPTGDEGGRGGRGKIPHTGYYISPFLVFFSKKVRRKMQKKSLSRYGKSAEKQPVGSQRIASNGKESGVAKKGG